MLKLQNKVAVVTGGSAGIGFAAARAFAREGATVFVTGRREAELGRAVDEIGHGAVAVCADAADLGDIDRLYAEVQAKAGRIDVLMLNAAYFEFVAFGEITEEHFEKTVATNLKGPFFAVQKAMPLLTKGASVILVGSTASRVPVTRMLVYGAAKAALRALVRGLVAANRGREIRFNMLTPGHTLTEAAASMGEARKAELVQAVPLGRLADPDDIAPAAVFLACDDSRYVTGIELDVDGGLAQI